MILGRALLVKLNQMERHFVAISLPELLVSVCMIKIALSEGKAASC